MPLQNLAWIPVSNESRARCDRCDAWIYRSQEHSCNELHGGRGVIDPLQVVHFVGIALDKCRTPSRKSVTIGVCVPRVPSTKPAGCKAAGYAYSRRASSTRYLTCLLAISTSHLRSPGVSVENIYACSLFNMSVGQALMEAEISTLTSSRVSSYLAELTRLDRIFKR